MFIRQIRLVVVVAVLFYIHGKTSTIMLGRSDNLTTFPGQA